MRFPLAMCALIGLTLALPAGAAPASQLIVLEAAPNQQTGLLTVVGVNFGSAAPSVKLGGQTLTLQSFSDSELVATLPALPAGTYQLLVARGPGTVDRDTFSVTIGAGGAGGDIESIAAGAGLLGGGASGDVTLEVDTDLLDFLYLRRNGSNNGPFARVDATNYFQGDQWINGFTQMSGGFNAPAPSFIEFTQPNQAALVCTNNADTGCNRGVHGQVWSECGTGVVGGALGLSGGTGGSFGSRGDGGRGVHATLEHATGGGIGVLSEVPSPNQVAGQFSNFGGGRILLGSGSSGVVFTVEGDGTVHGFDFISSSSRRYKTNVVELTGALGAIESLRPVSFDWKSTGKRDLGLIAEEVAAVVPDAVSFDGQGAQGIDYTSLTALLIEAVQEQQAKIRELERRLDARP